MFGLYRTPLPPPPGPIDCSTTPNDPSCKTTPPGGPIDCSTTPNDPSCVSQPPVDCKTKPDDPSCTTPPVDCTKNPDDPSCNVCQPAAIGISCLPSECPKDQHFDDNQNKCVPTCPDGTEALKQS